MPEEKNILPAIKLAEYLFYAQAKMANSGIKSHGDKGQVKHQWDSLSSQQRTQCLMVAIELLQKIRLHKEVEDPEDALTKLRDDNSDNSLDKIL